MAFAWRLDAVDGVRAMADNLALWAFVVSVGSFGVSVAAYVQSKKTAALSTRREGIDHVREAFYDVNIDGNIRTATINSLREAAEIAALVFSADVKAILDRAHRAAFGLQHIPFEQLTEQHAQDKEKLKEEIKAVLDRMRKEAALLPGWKSLWRWLRSTG